MEYRLTQKGRETELTHPTGGKILEFMKNGHGVVNPDEVKYELQMENSKSELDSLVKAGFLSKEEEDSGEDSIMGPDPYAHLG